MNAEDFEVTADRDGQLSLQCAAYARSCWWEIEFGSMWKPGSPGADLGSLLGQARSHIAAEHAA